MTSTVVTNAGISAALLAESKGMKVAINRFRIGSSVITPSPSMTDVTNFVYDSGADTNRLTVSVLNANTIVYKVKLDDQLGPFLVGNIGLFLTDGTMFSITSLNSPVQKIKSTPSQAGNILTFHILIQVSGITSAMNVTLNLIEDLQIPEVPTENHLPLPNNATSPLYHVLNYGGTGRSCLATRQTSPTSRWNFVIMTPNSPQHLLSFNNLSDLQNVSQARTNLGLGTAATRNTGTVENTVPLIGAGNVLPREILPLYQGATSSQPGIRGAVPPAAAGQTDEYFLSGDGVWRKIGTAVYRNVGTGSDQVPVLDSTGKLPRVVLPIYIGATSSTPGQTGSVPPAAAGQTDEFFLSGDGVWRKLGSAAYKNTGTGSDQIPILDSNGKLQRSTFPIYVGATSSSAGQTGSVPPAAAGQVNHVLTGDGNWKSLGTAAFKDVGLSQGNVPEISSGNKLDRSIIPTYLGASDNSPGQTGAVPPAAAGQSNHIFTGDGSWKSLDSLVKISPLYTISRGKNTYSHNLNRHPIILSAYIVCVSPELEWSAGDRIQIHVATWQLSSETVDFIYLATTTNSVILFVRSLKIVRKSATHDSEPQHLNLQGSTYVNWRFQYVYI